MILEDHVGLDMILLQCCTVGIVRTTSNQSPAQYSCSCVHWNVNIQVSSSLCVVSLYEPYRLYCANTPIYLYILLNWTFSRCNYLEEVYTYIPVWYSYFSWDLKSLTKIIGSIYICTYIIFAIVHKTNVNFTLSYAHSKLLVLDTI